VNVKTAFGGNTYLQKERGMCESISGRKTERLSERED
jgi:hypothetical protein